MLNILYIAAEIQTILLAGTLTLLLGWLFAGRIGGLRRIAREERLDGELQRYIQQPEELPLPPKALDTANGRAAVMAALARDGEPRSLQRIDELQLERRLTADLAHRHDRIRAMARLGAARLPGTPQVLERYWTSPDPDECYFSLYYSAVCVTDPAQRERVRAAIKAAPFPPGRKAEMLRLLDGAPAAPAEAEGDL